MGFPRTDVEFSRKPVAIVLNPANQFDYFKMEPHLSRFFVTKKYGIFEMDANSFSRSGQTPVGFYYSEFAKPINLKYLAVLHSWQKKNKIDKIMLKDIRHSALIDRFAAKHPDSDPIESATQFEMKELAAIHDKIDGINKQLEERNENRIKEDKPPITIDPRDYATYIIEELIHDALVTRDEGYRLLGQLKSQEINIDDFIMKLEDLKVITIATPIPLNPRKWLEGFMTFTPGDTMNYIKMTRGLGKKIEQLGVGQVKNLIPAAWIFMVVLGVTIGGAVLVQNVLPNLDNWFGKFFGG
jgi:hypothetical protein